MASTVLIYMNQLRCLPVSSFRWRVDMGIAVMTRPASSHSSDYVKEISYDELKAILGKSQNLLLVDVRTKGEVDQGRIPGSVHIPVDEVGSAFELEPEAFKAKYGVTKPPLDTPELVFHCQMGKRGGTATEKAYQLGFVNARNYAGAYKEWSEKQGK